MKKIFTLLMTVITLSGSSIVYADDTQTLDTLSEQKIHQDNKNLTILSVKTVNILSEEDINKKRDDSIDYIKTLTLTETQKNEAIEELKTNKKLSGFEELKTKYTKISEDNIAKEKEKQKREQELNGPVTFNADGTLEYQKSDAAQEVINLLLSIPYHKNGKDYHIAHGIDEKIDNLTIKECVYVMKRIEDPGFGQTGDGYEGQENATSHKAFVEHQLNNRFGGSIKNLLKQWGTFKYPGY